MHYPAISMSNTISHLVVGKMGQYNKSGGRNRKQKERKDERVQEEVTRIMERLWKTKEQIDLPPLSMDFSAMFRSMITVI